jgi:hypothetical protein
MSELHYFYIRFLKRPDLFLKFTNYGTKAIIDSTSTLWKEIGSTNNEILYCKTENKFNLIKEIITNNNKGLALLNIKSADNGEYLLSLICQEIICNNNTLYLVNNVIRELLLHNNEMTIKTI